MVMVMVMVRVRVRVLGFGLWLGLGLSPLPDAKVQLTHDPELVECVPAQPLLYCPLEHEVEQLRG